MLKKIAITGPESSGKTTIAKMLAAHFETVWVAEYARFYLNNLHRPYMESDLLEIAKGQIAMEEQFLPKANQFLFCDTDLTVIKIWSEVKYGRCNSWILEQIDVPRYDLYFLCAPDIAWEADPLRENPANRDMLYNLYVKELERQKVDFVVLRGSKSERLQTALDCLSLK